MEQQTNDDFMFNAYRPPFAVAVTRTEQTKHNANYVVHQQYFMKTIHMCAEPEHINANCIQFIWLYCRRRRIKIISVGLAIERIIFASVRFELGQAVDNDEVNGFSFLLFLPHPEPGEWSE